MVVVADVAQAPVDAVVQVLVDVVRALAGVVLEPVGVEQVPVDAVPVLVAGIVVAVDTAAVVLAKNKKNS